jgi:hypothetical protein
MFKNSDKEKHTETAIKLLNQYADSYHQLENKVKYLIQENKDLQQNLKINKEIIQSFFKNSSIDKKINVLISNIKSENNLLYSQIEKYKKEIRELTSSLNQMDNLKNELNISNNKIFVFENLISQKMNIIQNLNRKISLNKSKKNEHEIYIIDPNIAVNRMNDTLLHYKEANQKLTTHINTLKNTIERKEKEIKNKTNEINILKKELSHFNKQKNNVEIINQLNQYNAMNSSMNKNTLSKSYNVMHSNELYNILNIIYRMYSNKSRDNSVLPIEKLIEQIVLQIPIPLSGKQEINVNFSAVLLFNEKKVERQKHKTDVISTNLKLGTSKNEISFPLFNVNESFIPFYHTIPIEECFSFFQADDIIKIFKYIILEVPILFFCSEKKYLSAFIENFLGLLSPFNYVQPNISILPSKFYGLINSEPKFLFGINENYTPNFFKNNNIDIDKNIIVVNIDPINRTNS